MTNSQQIAQVTTLMRELGTVSYKEFKQTLKANGIPFDEFLVIMKELKRTGLVEEKRHHPHMFTYITPFIDDAVPYGTLPVEPPLTKGEQRLMSELEVAYEGLKEEGLVV